MIKYLDVTNGRDFIKFDKENEKMSALDNINSNVDWVWIIDEDGEFNGKEVKKGDVVFKMYSATSDYNEREYIIIKDEALKDYYRRLKEFYDNQRKPTSKCCDCECCSDSCIKSCQ